MNKKDYKAFKTIQKKWYKKLKKQGFDDIEWGYDSANLIKNPTEYTIKILNPDLKEHYEKASDFYWEYNWESHPDGAFHKYIWSQWILGKSFRKIANNIPYPHPQVSFYTIYRRVKHFIKLMNAWDFIPNDDFKEIKEFIAIMEGHD